MPPKLVASDLDGTLLTSEGTFDERTKRADSRGLGRRREPREDRAERGDDQQHERQHADCHLPQDRHHVVCRPLQRARNCKLPTRVWPRSFACQYKFKPTSKQVSQPSP